MLVWLLAVTRDLEQVCFVSEMIPKSPCLKHVSSDLSWLPRKPASVESVAVWDGKIDIPRDSEEP